MAKGILYVTTTTIDGLVKIGKTINRWIESHYLMEYLVNKELFFMKGQILKKENWWIC